MMLTGVHENIVCLYEVYVTLDRYAMAMELCTGETHRHDDTSPRAAATQTQHTTRAQHVHTAHTACTRA